MPSIRAPFTITARPAEESEASGLPIVGRTTFDKVFAGGAIEGTSVVHFVSTASESGPLAYVALERIEGALDGRSGAFVLQHVGAIVDGAPDLALTVVAGSGTGELTGLTGSGTIEHTEAGAHLDLDYDL
jgi:hypothetical protein